MQSMQSSLYPIRKSSIFIIDVACVNIFYFHKIFVSFEKILINGFYSKDHILYSLIYFLDSIPILTFSDHLKQLQILGGNQKREKKTKKRNELEIANCISKNTENNETHCQSDFQVPSFCIWLLMSQEKRKQIYGVLPYKSSQTDIIESDIIVTKKYFVEV